MKLQEMKKSIIEGDLEKGKGLAIELIQNKEDIIYAIENGFSKGIDEVGRLWDEGEYFLPELMAASEVMKEVMAILKPEIISTGVGEKNIGKVVIGTIEGDIHDIGKTIVATMLEVNGFRVIDLGMDVKKELFIKTAIEEKADIIGISALLTTTMTGQKDVIELLKKEGYREKIKVIVGGAPVNERWAMQIGADGYGKDALKGVEIAKKLLNYGKYL